MVENVLGQVLDAFQSRMTGLLGRCTCRVLADGPQLAKDMAKEPSAPQVTDSSGRFLHVFQTLGFLKPVMLTLSL